MIGTDRYELSETQAAKDRAAATPARSPDPGRSGHDNRLFVNGFVGAMFGLAQAAPAGTLRQVEERLSGILCGRPVVVVR